jgi:hypothetical protein
MFATPQAAAVSSLIDQPELTMPNTSVSRDQAIQLLEKLADDESFRLRMRANPRAALREPGLPARFWRRSNRS